MTSEPERRESAKIQERARPLEGTTSDERLAKLTESTVEDERQPGEPRAPWKASEPCNWESTKGRERAETADSITIAERATSAESTKNNERAMPQKSTMGCERARTVESTASRERAIRREST